MPPVVSLRAVAEEMDTCSDDDRAYLNKQSGELVTIRREEIAIVESDEDLENYPQWQQDIICMTREVLDDEDYLPLPSKFDIQGYAIMERFCYSVEDDELRVELLDRICGPGAFRRFKNAVHRLGIADDWHRFRQEALEEIAARWLDAKGVAYIRSQQC